MVPLKTFTSYITNSVSPNWRCQILLLFPPLHQLIFAEEEEEGRLHLATLSNFVLGCVNLCVAKFRFSGYQFSFNVLHRRGNISPFYMKKWRAKGFTLLFCIDYSIIMDI